MIKLIRVRYNQKLLQLPQPPLQVTFWEQYRAFYHGIPQVSALPDIQYLFRYTTINITAYRNSTGLGPGYINAFYG